MRISFALLLIALCFLPQGADAQLMGTAGTGTDGSFSVSVNPQYPAPNTSVSLSFLSDSIDLSNATLSVSVNGAVTYEGNVQAVSVPVGGAGKLVTVTAIMTSAGTRYRKTVIIQPQDVLLIAEPIASAPPLYRGKPNMPLEGDVRVVALASFVTSNGATLDPTSLAYTWTVDGTRIADSSGIGKSAIVVASPMEYRSRDVSVSVASQDGTAVGGASMVIDPKPATLRLYVNDPLLGVLFDRALVGTHSITGTESTLYAAPYSLATTGGTPLVQWFLNNTAAETGPLITLRPSGKGEGTANLSVTAGGGGYTRATSELKLFFGASKNFNFFGL